MRCSTDASASKWKQSEGDIADQQMTEIRLWVASLLENALIKIFLNLTLWPLKLIYRQPEPTWPAWFANRKLCQLDQRYC